MVSGQRALGSDYYTKPAMLNILPLDMANTLQETCELEARFSKLFGG